MWDQPFIKEGWLCPVCRRVFSPDTPWCYFCGGEAKTVTTDKLTVNDQPIEEFINVWTGERYPLRKER